MGAEDRQPADMSARKPRERRERIKGRVVDRGFVRIEQLADELGVTTMTIRRDLDYLQDRGWLRKVRGARRLSRRPPSTATSGTVPAP